MRILLSIIFFSLSFVFLLCQNQTSSDLGSVLDELASVFDEIEDSGIIEGKFEIKVTLNNVVSDNDGLSLKILFFEFKKSAKRIYDNSFTANYTVEVKEKIRSNAYNFNQRLANDIILGIAAYQESSDERFEKTGFKLKIAFTLSTDVSLGGETVVIEPISVGFNRRRSRKTVHTVEIVYKPNQSIGNG
ncbi:MAG: hypothetical protein AAGG75_25540 [Bacteroidota bacterium]